MNKKTRSIISLMLVLIFATSMILMLPATQAQPPATSMKTYPIMDAVPNPVGVGEHSDFLVSDSGLWRSGCSLRNNSLPCLGVDGGTLPGAALDLFGEVVTGATTGDTEGSVSAVRFLGIQDCARIRFILSYP